MRSDKIKEAVATTQQKWWEQQGLPSPVVNVEDFDAGKGRVPDIRGEFGYFPTSILVLNRPKELYDFLADRERPHRHVANAYHPRITATIFPPVAAWFCLKYWSRPGDVVLDPFGNRANIGLVANWLGRRVKLNDIVPSYCRLMEAAGKRRPKKGLTWRVLNQDAANLTKLKTESVDFILTGPPYFNVEKYEEVPGQASSFRTYKEFLAWYSRVAEELLRITKPLKFCAFKVANWRKNGRLVQFVRDTQETFEAAGWELHDELICVERAPLGLGWSWASKWRNRVVSKAHQTILVFRKPE